MLVALAFVPSAPLLLPALGGGPDDLRSACRQAISVLDDVERLVVVGAAPRTGRCAGTVDATGWGAPGAPAADPLPLALAVGAGLLGDRPAELYGVADGTAPGLVEGERRTGLLVVGDGTAKRTEKAPGHFDPRAAELDERVVKAVAAGDLTALRELDAALADELWVGGRQAWAAAAAAAQAEVRPGGAAPGGWTGEVSYAAAPYGVGYLVATWLPADLVGV
jgi:hypothetical protein